MAEVLQTRYQEIKLIKVDSPEVNIRYTGRSSSIVAQDSDPTWQILREYKNGDITSLEYANKGSFSAVWDDRETYFSAATPDPSNPLDSVSIAADVIVSNSIVPFAYDGVYATYPAGNEEVYTYKLGSTTVAVVTVTYSSSTKLTLTSVVRT